MTCSFFCSDFFLVILAIFFPPLPVWFRRGLCSADSFINIALCCLGFVPGLIHSWYIIARYPLEPSREYDQEGQYYIRVASQPGNTQNGYGPRYTDGAHESNRTNRSGGGASLQPDSQPGRVTYDSRLNSQPMSTGVYASKNTTIPQHEQNNGGPSNYGSTSNTEYQSIGQVQAAPKNEQEIPNSLPPSYDQALQSSVNNP